MYNGLSALDEGHNRKSFCSATTVKSKINYPIEYNTREQLKYDKKNYTSGATYLHQQNKIIFEFIMRLSLKLW